MNAVVLFTDIALVCTHPSPIFWSRIVVLRSDTSTRGIGNLVLEFIVILVKSKHNYFALNSQQKRSAYYSHSLSLSLLKAKAINLVASKRAIKLKQFTTKHIVFHPNSILSLSKIPSTSIPSRLLLLSSIRPINPERTTQKV